MGELHDSDAAQLAPLRERLRASAACARSRMLDMLDRPSTRRLVRRMRVALARPAPVRVRADNPVAAVVAPKLIRRSFKKVRRAAQAVRADGSASAHHALRRRAKRLRYTIEAFDGFYGDEAQRLLQAIRRLQKSLGSNQDAHVAADRFHAMVQLARQALAARDVVLDRRFRRAESQRRRGCPPACAEAIREAAWPSMEGLAARDEQAYDCARRALEPELAARPAASAAS